MAAAAQMSDLKPLPGSQRAGAGEHTGQHRDMIEKVRCARARPRPRPESSDKYLRRAVLVGVGTRRRVDTYLQERPTVGEAVALLHDQAKREAYTLRQPL